MKTLFWPGAPTARSLKPSPLKSPATQPFPRIRTPALDVRLTFVNLPFRFRNRPAQIGEQFAEQTLLVRLGLVVVLPVLLVRLLRRDNRIGVGVVKFLLLHLRGPVHLLDDANRVDVLARFRVKFKVFAGAKRSVRVHPVPPLAGLRGNKEVLAGPFDFGLERHLQTFDFASFHG